MLQNLICPCPRVEINFSGLGNGRSMRYKPLPFRSWAMLGLFELMSQLFSANFSLILECNFAWQAQYLVGLGDDACYSAHWKWRFTMRGATRVTLQPHQILRLPRKMNLMIRVTYKTSFTMRGATRVTRQLQQIMRLPRKMNLKIDPRQI